jgi:transposase-like protein
MLKESHPRLADVQAAFAQWRHTRTTARTPLALRQQAVGLLAEHRISEVMSALGVNHGQLSRWRREVSTATGVTTDSAFIELPTALCPAPEVALPPAGVSLTLTRAAPDGSAVSITGQLSEAQWRWALRLLQERGA